jgi:hypothetical protein
MPPQRLIVTAESDLPGEISEIGIVTFLYRRHPAETLLSNATKFLVKIPAHPRAAGGPAAFFKSVDRVPSCDRRRTRRDDVSRATNSVVLPDSSRSPT